MLSKIIEQTKSLSANDAPINPILLEKKSEAITDARSPITIGVYILLIGFLAFLLWAGFAPLDEGVPAAATITVESKRKIVQHLTGGIIKKILVVEAQEVKAGDPLIMLDDTSAKANYEASRKQYFALQAQVDRLEAEASGAKAVSFSPSLMEEASDPIASENMAAQQRLMLTRRDALLGEQSILTSAKIQAEENIRGLEAQALGKQAQLAMVNEQLKGSRALAEEGYLPRNRLFEEERLAADLQASLSGLESSILRTKSLANESALRLKQRQRDFQKEVETQLSDLRREAMVSAERLRSATEDFHRTVIRAPVDGFVNGMSPLTEGSVTSPAGRLMDIVPKDEALIFEARIESRVIDRVHTGLPVDIHLAAFANDPGLVLEGVLETVSVDLVPDTTANVPPHYLGRVRVTPEGMKKLGSRILQPGMPAQVTIKTGERTLLQYMIKPLLMRLSAAMKES